MAAAAISSRLQLEEVLHIIKVLDMPAPRAVAHSASGWALPWPPVGAIITGKLMSVPCTVVAILRSVVSRRNRGRRVRDSKAERLRAVVISSIEPASMNSQLLWGQNLPGAGLVVVKIDGVQSHCFLLPGVAARNELPGMNFR